MPREATTLPLTRRHSEPAHGMKHRPASAGTGVFLADVYRGVSQDLDLFAVFTDAWPLC
jgi:hypothetical protein